MTMKPEEKQSIIGAIGHRLSSDATDSESLAWMTNFAELTGAQPATYFLNAHDISVIGTAVEKFNEAYCCFESKATVDHSLVGAARRTATVVCKRYSTRIKYNPDVSDQDKIAIGIRPIQQGFEFPS